MLGQGVLSWSLLVYLADWTCGQVTEDSLDQSCPRKLNEGKLSANVPILHRYQTYLLLLLGFCGFSVVLAFLYNTLRKHVFRDFQHLDTTFDAGGRVTLSLTATTVATQLLWPADLLQSATVATKNGLAGPFWYSVGVVSNILLFPLLSVEFKTKAPGAKTYLQVIYARFGWKPHVVYCVFALITNLVITSCLVLAARATIQSVTVDASDEMVVVILAIMCGSYSYVGGLGTTFYVSYFNASMIFIMLIVLIVNVFYVDNDYGENLGTIHKMYVGLNCTTGPDGNTGTSFLTFQSEGSLVFGVIGIFLASSVTFCDQASWQSRIAAKPTQGVWGFLIAAFIWYAIPSTLSLTTGMAYLVYSSDNGTHLLSSSEIDEGFVTPFIASQLLGEAGAFMVLSMVSMALMSTGSGEVMAVASILVYDIYQKYIRPFRRDLPDGHCILCGKEQHDKSTITLQDGKRNGQNTKEECSCVRAEDCGLCQVDMAKASADEPWSDVGYNCSTHGAFRNYQDTLIRYKNWCIVWVSVSIIPFGLLIITTGINLNWAFTAGAVITIGFCPAVFLCILWAKTTGTGITIGGIVGLAAGVATTLGMATTFEGGLADFLTNTGQDYSVLGGCCASFGVSLILSIVISLFTHNIKHKMDEEREWQKTISITNPLHPWQLAYLEDFPEVATGYIPNHRDMSKKFRRAKILAIVGCVGGLAILLVIVPVILSTLGVMTEAQFTAWVYFCHVWTFLMAAFVVLAPPIQEVIGVVKQYRVIKKMDKEARQSRTGINGPLEVTEM